MSELFLVLQMSPEVSAQFIKLGAAFTAVMALFAATWGISKIAKTALEGIARQPETANDLRQAMIVSAALIEGATFFAILICLLILFVV